MTDAVRVLPARQVVAGTGKGNVRVTAHCAVRLYRLQVQALQRVVRW